MPPESRIAIGVCTAHRPELLRKCLAALAAQTVPPGVEIAAIIVDNEPTPSSRPIVEAAGAAAPFPFLYVHEPRRGIAKARNAALAACADRYDWIAFTDDDCEPAPDWIASLLAAARKYGVEVVYGQQVYVPPQPVPFWYVSPNFGFAEGDRIGRAATHNVLISGALVGPSGLRFDERMAHGEDTDFFYRAVRGGARIVYSAIPVVYEAVPPQRCTLAFQSMRSFHYGAADFDIMRRYHGLGFALTKLIGSRLLHRVPVALVRLMVTPLVWPFGPARFKRHVFKVSKRLMEAAGAVAGTAGFIGNPYRNVGRASAVGAPPPGLDG